MCTAATYKTKDFYFGRTLDYEFSYGEEIVVSPRNFEFEWRNVKGADKRYAIIGMAHVEGDYPLYYDAINEKGLGMAGLNFVGNAKYSSQIVQGKDNVAQFELIPWILTQCDSVSQAKELLGRINITDTPFAAELPVASLHWIIADKESAITVESVKEGLKVYDNPVGVLTNNPPFDMQLFNLNNFMSLSPRSPQNAFCEQVPLSTYSRGMGAIGLPGDLSSASRFVRASFVRGNSKSADTEEASVNQFFHILGSVEQQRGCCEVEDGKYEITIYTSCCNATKGIYYYTTYDNHQISKVDMHKVDLDGSKITAYPMLTGEKIYSQN